MIVKLRAGNVDARWLDIVKINGFALLDSVPKNDTVWGYLNHAFVGEIIPTCHGKDRRNTKVPCSLDVVSLTVSEIEHGTDDDEIGGPSSECG